jgi:hypothetical protein
VATAGWDTLTGHHWVGYTFPVSGVSGVRAEWEQPQVTGQTSDEVFVWIGLGGWNQTEGNIIQIGTFGYFPTAYQLNEGIWYEHVPGPLAQYPLKAVGPGDEVAASIVEAGRDEWRMTLNDISSGMSYTKVLKFDSLGSYPDFVVEDPDKGNGGANGPFVPFARWGTVSFSDMEVLMAGQWKPAASIYGYRIQMVRGDQTLATAGPLSTRSGFTARQS